MQQAWQTEQAEPAGQRSRLLALLRGQRREVERALRQRGRIRQFPGLSLRR